MDATAMIRAISKTYRVNPSTIVNQIQGQPVDVVDAYLTRLEQKLKTYPRTNPIPSSLLMIASILGAGFLGNVAGSVVNRYVSRAEDNLETMDIHPPKRWESVVKAKIRKQHPNISADDLKFRLQKMWALKQPYDKIKYYEPAPEVKQVQKNPLTKEQEATNWLRDLFYAYNLKISDKDLKSRMKQWSKVYGKETINKAFKSLRKDKYIIKKGKSWVWPPVPEARYIATNPQYPFTILSEGVEKVGFAGMPQYRIYVKLDKGAKSHEGDVIIPISNYAYDKGWGGIPIIGEGRKRGHAQYSFKHKINPNPTADELSRGELMGAQQYMDIADGFDRRGMPVIAERFRQVARDEIRHHGLIQSYKKLGIMKNPSVAVSVPHAGHQTGDDHPFDVTADRAAILLSQAFEQMSPNLKAKVAISHMPRDLQDQNRKGSRASGYRKELRKSMKMADYVVDVHSYPANDHDWGSYDFVVFHIPGVTPKALGNRMVTKAKAVGIRGKVVQASNINDIVTEAWKDFKTPAVLLEFNEGRVRDYPAIAQAIAMSLPIYRKNPSSAQYKKAVERYKIFQDMEPLSDMVTYFNPGTKVKEKLGNIRSLVYFCSKWSDNRKDPENTDIPYEHTWEKNHPILAKDNRGNLVILGPVEVERKGIDDWGIYDWFGKVSKKDMSLPKMPSYLAEIGDLEEIVVTNGSKIKKYNWKHGKYKVASNPEGTRLFILPVKGARWVEHGE